MINQFDNLLRYPIPELMYLIVLLFFIMLLLAIVLAIAEWRSGIKERRNAERRHRIWGMRK